MKAFLLAAGVGSRLRPITNTIPKCMVVIDGQAWTRFSLTCTTCRTWCVTT